MFAKKRFRNENISFFYPSDSAIAGQQLEALEHIAALPMSLAESKVIKPLVDSMDNLLREWILADKDVKGDSYALKRMLVISTIYCLISLNDVIFQSFLGGTRCTVKQY